MEINKKTTTFTVFLTTEGYIWSQRVIKNKMVIIGLREFKKGQNINKK